MSIAILHDAIEKPHWRLILDPPASGAWNMAVDEALLTSAANPGYINTLRVYSWQPACLSLGQAQPVNEVDRERLSNLGWDLVRRPTGGRAILHTDEITYSLTGSCDDPLFVGGILPSYQRIARSLIGFLSNLGLEPESREAAGTFVGNPQAVCFEVPSHYEITIHEKKIIGSAQARRRNAVLQHGTIPLFGDIRRITQVLAYPDENLRQIAANRVKERATTVQDEISTRISYPSAVIGFIHAFELTQEINLIEGKLTSDEEKIAGQLMTEKYSQDVWTKRV
jgi:lipoate-protein ligase A